MLPLPAPGFVVEVDCPSAPSAPGGPHPVTITPDWRLLTPHNLDAERVAVALGGACPCVDLADRTLPAVRGYVTHRLRLEAAAIVHAADGSWRIVADAGGCCRGQGFPTARDAAAHLRRPQHWEQRYGAAAGAVAALARPLLEAIEGSSESRVGNLAFDPRCPVPGPGEAPPLAEASGLAVLWDAGLHPADVARLCTELAAAGGVVALKDVLQRAYGSDTDAPPTRAGRRRGRRRPDERADWLAAGVPPGTVNTLLSADAYSLDDARILGSRLSRSVGVAAGILARWQAAGMTPAVDTLVGLYWGPMLMDAPPPARQVERTLDAARAAGLEASPVDAALALIRTGTPSAAVAMLADPIRRPDDPYSP